MSKNKKNFFESKREWSEIKDNLLACYLQPYFQKMLATHKPTLYIDCFAGKGKFDDEKDGSPLIALKARDDCFKRSKISNKLPTIETNFIELNHSEALQTNINDFTNKDYGVTKVIKGRYEEKIIECLKDKNNYNVFLYIDPYGIKALDSNLFNKFQGYNFSSFEMLINFNSFGFFRNACNVMSVNYDKDNALEDLSDLIEYEPTQIDSSKKSENLLTNIAGGDYWKNIVKDYRDKKIDGYEAEQRLSTKYKQYLKQKYKYVLDMPIRLKAKNRPKYRMIHISNHIDGCYLMAENMQRRKNELFFYIQQKGQATLFDNSSEYSSSVEGNLISKEDIELKLNSYLQECPKEVRYTRFISDFFNNYGLLCEFKVLTDILEQMKNKGQIEIIRTPAVTKSGRLTKFWEEAEFKGKTITIRRLKT